MFQTTNQISFSSSFSAPELDPTVSRASTGPGSWQSKRNFRQKIRTLYNGKKYDFRQKIMDMSEKPRVEYVSIVFYSFAVFKTTLG